MVNEFKTLKSTSIAEYKDRGSKFIAYASFVQNEEEALEKIKALWKEHPKARHICYAYTLGCMHPSQRLHDDGEPTHTAAAPIANMIRKHGLHHVLVAVVRYFGGILLGKGGLIKAYGTAAEEAIKMGEFVTFSEKTTLEFTFSFEFYSKVMALLNKNSIEILKQDFGDNCTFHVLVDVQMADQLNNDLSSYIIIQKKPL